VNSISLHLQSCLPVAAKRDRAHVLVHANKDHAHAIQARASAGVPVSVNAVLAARAFLQRNSAIAPDANAPVQLNAVSHVRVVPLAIVRANVGVELVMHAHVTRNTIK
jgi:hypothetical protein